MRFCLELESLRIQMAKLKTRLSETEEKNGKRAQDINNIYQKDIEDLTKNNRVKNQNSYIYPCSFFYKDRTRRT